MKINRRRLFTAMGAGLLTLPLGIRAQAPARYVRLGYLTTNPGASTGEEAFMQSMRGLGYVEGRNLSVEWRFAKGNPALLPELAAELVRLNVDVLVAALTPAIQAAKSATSSVPIVMAASGDPVATGLIASLARPGGNITGMSGLTGELTGKCLEIARDLHPTSKQLAVMVNSLDPFGKTYLDQVETAARRLSVSLQTFMIRGDNDIEQSFRDMVRTKTLTVLVQGSLQRKSIHDLAIKNRIASIASTSGYADNGGLISYAGTINELYGNAAAYVDKILKGAKPADLPVAQPTRFELVINMKTAKALGVRVPQTLLARADRVIS